MKRLGYWLRVACLSLMGGTAVIAVPAGLTMVGCGPHLAPNVVPTAEQKIDLQRLQALNIIQTTWTFVKAAEAARPQLISTDTARLFSQWVLFATDQAEKANGNWQKGVADTIDVVSKTWSMSEHEQIDKYLTLIKTIVLPPVMHFDVVTPVVQP